MSIENKVARQMRGVRGAMKKMAGRASGDRTLEARGRREQVRADLGRAADKVRAAFKR